MLKLNNQFQGHLKIVEKYEIRESAGKVLENYTKINLKLISVTSKHNKALLSSKYDNMLRNHVTDDRYFVLKVHCNIANMNS